jgi:hypothetical protein
MEDAMRRDHQMGLALAIVLALAGCGHAGRGDAAGSTSTPQPHRVAAPAPADPDLASVMERFYQHVEGAHWAFAYGMLSPRYRAIVTRQALTERYASLVNPDITLRQNGRSITARLDAADRNDRSRTLHVQETIRLVWDGERWTIDDIARRTVTAGTR